MNHSPDSQTDCYIILVSTSPRRQQLLSLVDVTFDIMSVDIDETVFAEENPQDYIKRMVDTKAAVACNELAKVASNNKLHSSQSINSAVFTLVITADTIGVLPDGLSILVKPIDKADAFAMWTNMSGNQHSVWTAVQLSLLDESGVIISRETILEKTEVTFISLTEHDMESYWKSGEPQDKAGGYAIQGKGAAWVEKIDGSYTNVVGLPLAQTQQAIDKLLTTIKN